jgi:hypothetical protein
MTMKKLVLLTILATVLFGGFFQDETRPSEQEVIESERLCTLFQKKAEAYKKTMRHDLLAKVTLASYEERANLFCNKAKELRAARGEKGVTSESNTTDAASESNNTNNTPKVAQKPL